jgi:hypothetical protein
LPEAVARQTASTVVVDLDFPYSSSSSLQMLERMVVPLLGRMKKKWARVDPIA